MEGVETDVSGDIEYFNIVIMTQSCDFQKFQDRDEVILCPRHDYLEISGEFPRYAGKDGWKKLIDGRFVGVQLINQCNISGYEFGYQLVDLRRIFSMPLAIVKRFASKQGPHLRLLPPYREHLAQAFAQQFMRVGLPIDLPKDPPLSKKG